MSLTKLSAHGSFHPLPFGGISSVFFAHGIKTAILPHVTRYEKIFKTRDRYITKYVQRIFKNEI